MNIPIETHPSRSSATILGREINQKASNLMVLEREEVFVYNDGPTYLSYTNKIIIINGFRQI